MHKAYPCTIYTKDPQEQMLLGQRCDQVLPAPSGGADLAVSRNSPNSCPGTPRGAQNTLCHSLLAYLLPFSFVRSILLPSSLMGLLLNCHMLLSLHECVSCNTQLNVALHTRDHPSQRRWLARNCSRNDIIETCQVSHLSPSPCGPGCGPSSATLFSGPMFAFCRQAQTRWKTSSGTH